MEFYFYEVFKNNLFPGIPKHELLYTQKILCGALTGIVAATSFYPADVMKTYLIIEKNNKKIGLSNVASEIVKKHGFRGFYKGLGTTAAGVTPFVAFRMSTYEFLAHDKKIKEMNPFKDMPGGAEI